MQNEKSNTKEKDISLNRPVIIEKRGREWKRGEDGSAAAARRRDVG